MKQFLQILILTSFLSRGYSQSNVIVLGIAQDGGYPHLGCEKECCNKAWKNDSLKRFIVSLALVDPVSKNWWLFEATPDIKEQLQYFKTLTKGDYNYLPSGIFLTHAHIGHYTGLMQLGREVMNTKEIPVYVLPKMKNFLETNGPWSQLVTLKNISLYNMDTVEALELQKGIMIHAYTVPHRDEFSETAGFKIVTEKASYLFIPDIDKWTKWNKSIIEEVKKVTYAFVDATFNEITELKNRKVEEVPHPFVSETMEFFKNESRETKAKLHFIHFNHTNPVMWDKTAKQKVLEQGFKVAEQGRGY
ncbi:MAG: pyrroloquinoline quinone biosynthesis protein PqqB [Bacteroidia bacterium]|nr:pyrroloquinoline quinone biosynthesis protein PqqB [Bacteroidia bacterium]